MRDPLNHTVKIFFATVGLFFILFLTTVPFLKKDFPLITGYISSLSYWLEARPSSKTLASYRETPFPSTSQKISATPAPQKVDGKTSLPSFPQLGASVFIDQGKEDEEDTPSIKKTLVEYVEVTGGCTAYFEGECLNVRSGPGTEYPVINRLRNGVTLKIDGLVEKGEETWYKVVFDEWLRYPERAQKNWYVLADYVEIRADEGNKILGVKENISTTKRIIVDRSEQVLVAYNGDELFMETPISSGVELTPTPRGIFHIFKKTPSRYMQGPIPGITTQYYDLPGVPWNLYFTKGGAIIHGAYWHNEFGTPHSNGCVNIPLDMARKLYDWADLGTSVTIKD